MESRPITIYVDADACPVKQEVYRVAKRFDLPVVVVANTPIRVPDEDQIEFVLVEGKFDAADDWIVERVERDDIVVTTDIPLASRSIKKGARVITPTGLEYTPNNIGSAMANRELMSRLRETGVIAGGPAPCEKSDRSRFLYVLDETIKRIMREHSQDR